MKYLKLFEHWLNEAEGGKLFTEYKIGDFRGASDKSQFLLDFFSQFTEVPNRSIKDQTAIEELKVTESGVTFYWESLFYKKGNVYKNEEIYENEYKKIFKDEKSQKRYNEYYKLVGSESIRFELPKRRDKEEFESLLEYFESAYEKLTDAISKSELKDKESKIEQILKKDLERIRREVKNASVDYPENKIIKIKLKLKSLRDPRIIYISKGMGDKDLNPDGAKLIDFKWDRITENDMINGQEFSNKDGVFTFGNIAAWLYRDVTPTKQGRGATDWVDEKPEEIASVLKELEPQVKKGLIASAKKRK